MTPVTPLSLDRILKVGSTLYLYVKAGLMRHERKLGCELVGWQEGRFLLVTHPREGGSTAALPANEPVVLRYVLDGEVFGLRAQVMRVQFQPVPLVFLTFPTEIENVPLRSQPRVSVRLPAVVSWLPANRPPSGVHFGFLIDVTPDGALLDVALPEAAMLKGRSLHVTFALGMDDEIRVNASVRNVAQDGHGYRLGLIFNWTSPDDRERVRVFCRLH